MVVETPQQETSIGLALRAEIMKCDRPCHAAMQRYLHHFSLPETILGGQGDARAVAYRSVVLVEARAGLPTAAVDLRRDIIDAADFSATVDEGFNLLGSLARCLHLEHIRLPAREGHVRGDRLLFPHDEAECRTHARMPSSNSRMMEIILAGTTYGASDPQRRERFADSYAFWRLMEHIYSGRYRGRCRILVGPVS